MAKMGRPLKQINWELFDKLVSFQCTQEEIAAAFDCDVDTINAALIRDRGETFSDVWHKRRLFGRVRLRKAQFENVEAGKPGWAAMAIWLDKKMFPEENPDREPPKDVTPNLITLSTTQKKTFREFCADAGYPTPFEKQEEMRHFAFSLTDVHVLLGARGYGKTEYITILGEAYEVYSNWFDYKYLGKAINETCLIVTKSKSRNTAIIGEIAAALKANGVPLEKENASVIRVEGLIGPNHSVEAITIKSSMRGRHPKRIIMDDPVTDEDTSAAMRKLVKKRYDEAYKLKKNMLIIGQPAHADDLYAELRDKVDTMAVPHGTIPDLDADLVAMEKAGVDKVSIEMSYHLRVPVEGSMPFAALKFIDTMPVGETVAFIDPSDGGDYTAVTLLRAYMDGIAVEGYCWKKAWYHCEDDLVRIFKTRKTTRVCFETNSTGEQPVIQLRQLLKPLGIGVVGKHSDSNKHAIIMAAGGYSHLIHLSKQSDPTYTKLVTKYEHDADYDDPPDSLARGLEWLGLIRGRK